MLTTEKLKQVEEALAKGRDKTRAAGLCHPNAIPHLVKESLADLDAALSLIREEQAAPPQPAVLAAENPPVDWLGLALDLEAQAKRVESQTVERAMLAASRGLRLMGAKHEPAPKAIRRTETWTV